MSLVQSGTKYGLSHGTFSVMNIYNLTFSCDIYVCVHVEIYIYTRLRLPFRGNFQDFFLASLLSIHFHSTSTFNINGSYKYFPSNWNNRSSHTQCTYGYSKFEILRKFFSPILHFPVSRTKRSRAKSCCENSPSTSGTVPYIVTPRVIQ